MQPPRWGQVREFCRKLGYRETRTDHYHYVKVLPDRLLSRTMISFGSEGEVVPSKMWLQVWRHQLRLASEEEFWRGLEGGEVRYATSPEPEPNRPLPPYLLRFLRETRHLSEEEITGLTREDAQETLNRHFSEELNEGS